MLEKIKRNKYQILELIIIFVITLIYNLICMDFTGDEIWNYGFSYNISTGLIPYKDFNMVMTPLFPILGAIFLNIFGKSLFIYHIFNAIVCTTIFHYMKKQIPKNYYIIYIIFLSISYPSYNILCILLLYVLMTLEDKKANDYIIGIFLGLTFLTKQNIGIYLCLPTLFIKDIKRMFKRVIGFIIPILILIVYLLINNSIYEFIDYTFLGLNSFAKENLIADKISLIIVIISTILLIYKYIKTKDIKIIYLLSFQLSVLPIIEKYHVMVALIPILGYFISNFKKCIKSITLVSITYLTVLISLNIYSIYKNDSAFPNETEVFTYRSLDYQIINPIKYIIDYTAKIDEELYIISANAYLIKLEANIPINKYDLLNKGNLGSGGPIKIIEEIKENCSNKKCVFLIDLDSSNNKTVYAKEIKDYIKENYTRHNIVWNLVVYKNTD